MQSDDNRRRLWLMVWMLDVCCESYQAWEAGGRLQLSAWQLFGRYQQVARYSVVVRLRTVDNMEESCAESSLTAVPSNKGRRRGRVGRVEPAEAVGLMACKQVALGAEVWWAGQRRASLNIPFASRSMNKLQDTKQNDVCKLENARRWVRGRCVGVRL